MDAADAIATLASAETVASGVGAAVLAVLGIVLGFKMVRRAFS